MENPNLTRQQEGGSDGTSSSRTTAAGHCTTPQARFTWFFTGTFTLQNPRGLYNIYFALKFVLVHGHAKYWSGLSLFRWCLRRGDLGGTGIKYLDVVDQGKQCILI